MAQSAQLLVVEDEPAVAGLITTALTLAGYQVTVAQNAAQALACTQSQTFDLALIDWMMPQVSGIELAKRLRQEPHTRELPIIMLTARATEGDKIAGLEVGADDYITKPFSPRELVARVQALLRRTQPMRGNQLLSVGVLQLDPEQHKAWVVQPDIASNDTLSVTRTVVDLSHTEFKLLHCLMLRLERVNTRAVLLAMAWDDASRVDERTVDAHVKSLRRSLQAAGCPSYIQTHRGVGYSLSLSVDATHSAH